MTSPNRDRSPAELAESDVEFLEAEMSADPRTFPRFAFRGRARAVVFPPEGRTAAEPQECEVLTTDVSRGGLSILYRKQLYTGQQILLVLNDANRLVEVCWCCRVWAGLYSAGCRFIGLSGSDAAE
jgi:PilZ domain